MALEKEPEADLLESVYHGQLEKSAVMLNALIVLSFRSDSPQRAEELLEIESYGLGRF